MFWCYENLNLEQGLNYLSFASIALSFLLRPDRALGLLTWLLYSLGVLMVDFFLSTCLVVFSDGSWLLDCSICSLALCFLMFRQWCFFFFWLQNAISLNGSEELSLLSFFGFDYPFIGKEINFDILNGTYGQELAVFRVMFDFSIFITFFSW